MQHPKDQNRRSSTSKTFSYQIGNHEAQGRIRPSSGRFTINIGTEVEESDSSVLAARKDG